MALIDVLKFRTRWQHFLASKRWMEDHWPHKPPEEKKALWDKFVTEIQEPVDQLWMKLTTQEKESLRPWMFPHAKEPFG